MIILAGPTAVGKTELSIQLAKRHGGEIISADSMQVYKGMNIGTAKIKKEDMGGIPHYLIDKLSPKENFHVVLFQQFAKQYINEIYAKGKIPMIVGGTGFYIQSVLYDIDFKENKTDNLFRSQLEQAAKEKGEEYLHGILMEKDPKSGKKIHPHNIKRVIRALEYFHQTGQPIAEHNEQEALKTSPYEAVYFVLNMPREELYERLNQRVDLMIEEGFVDEVKKLKEEGCLSHMVSMQGLGYKEIFQYLEGQWELEQAVTFLKRNTRHFAKRQLTWFRREKEIVWVNKEQFHYDQKAILDYMTGILKEKHIDLVGKEKI